MNSNLISIIQFMFLIMCFTSILSYALYTYNNFKHKFQRNIVKKVLLQWVNFIEKLLPDQYIVYEKYGIWRYVERLKIKMMF
ncbi:MAG: hypothetical protein ABF633_14115 [Clostridium sp.]|uniref:hypothetical protein n=1 Tax=Clostridium sp. TaxID=1506 RepID=UPI0039E9370F